MTSGGSLVTVMHPERRYFQLQNQTTGETAIRTNLLADLYVALGDADTKGDWTVRVYWKPLVPWIWLGARHHGVRRHGQPERSALAGRCCRARQPAGVTAGCRRRASKS